MKNISMVLMVSCVLGNGSCSQFRNESDSDLRKRGNVIGVTLEWGFDEKDFDHQDVSLQVAYGRRQSAPPPHVYSFRVYKDDSPNTVAELVEALIRREGRFNVSRDPTRRQITIHDLPNDTTLRLVEHTLTPFQVPISPKATLPRSGLTAERK